MNRTTSMTVKTGSRLHFGLTRYRPSADARFNGIGVMIDHPCTELLLTPSDSFRNLGSVRIGTYAEAWCHTLGRSLPNCQIEVINAPAEHSGLGSGTQMAHAVAFGINDWLGLEPPEPGAAARRLDRGNRSMIGSIGFSMGGLVVDRPGKPDLLATRQSMPQDWRAVLVLHRTPDKTFGSRETAAFNNICVEQVDRARTLENMIQNEIGPAVQKADFDLFCSAVHRYGAVSGEYYVDVQGGVYNGPAIQNVVDTMTDLGARGVGQSSWGPVVFSWCASQTEADQLVVRLTDRLGHSANIWIAKPMNRPAAITYH